MDAKGQIVGLQEGRGDSIGIVFSFYQYCVGFHQKPFIKLLEYDDNLAEVTDVYTRDDNDKKNRKKFDESCVSVEAATITFIIILLNHVNFSSKETRSRGLGMDNITAAIFNLLISTNNFSS